MLEIIVIVIIGRWFLELAKKFEKPQKWIYPIIGVVCYIAGAFGTGIVWAFTVGSTVDYGSFDSQRLLLTLISIPVGAGVAAIVYFLLKKSWTDSKEGGDQEILDEL